jgi:hypothetical protein
MRDFADNLAGLFVARDVPEEHQECLRRDFAELGPQETAHQAARAEKLLRGFLAAVEEDNPTLYLALSRAQALIMQARERAEGYAGAYNHR